MGVGRKTPCGRQSVFRVDVIGKIPFFTEFNFWAIFYVCGGMAALIEKNRLKKRASGRF